ncbi:hypothetical protein H6G17_24340 [Chroococcidiopsis sp. FACHB-1243]|uniref:hypothetical protein n=1 Tax=Chroococcidiopsis sp. [FACHB-1243] TaxID=2692781 RepID=UPI0017827122|nr:hypothetical protein [Chroococcidiopsis sp. [FACHB-1243]]MBD2308604.1 hypothetical protein [Chroococcidiopsis sp. [FACHB-1243]]
MLFFSSNPIIAAPLEGEKAPSPATTLSDRTSVKNEQIGDPELGVLRLQEQQLQSPPDEPIAHLLGQVGYFQGSNIFSAIDAIDDRLFSTNLTFAIAPKLGSKTSLFTAIDGGLVRYSEHNRADYNKLRLRAILRQKLTPRMFGEIGWNNQYLFDAKTGDRFLNEHALRLALQRQDKITNELWLNSTYEFRLGFAEPDTRSRAINSLSTELSYHISPRFQVSLEYLLALSNFTQRDRDDTYHLILGSAIYAVSRGSQISLQSGVSFGNSSDPNIGFNNSFFSVNYTFDIGNW